MNLESRYDIVKNEIRQAELECNLEPESVQLLAVSKTWPAAQLRQLAKLGQVDFGENYLQEALSKIEQLQDLNLTWHFIGPIQSNKTRAIAEQFDWVQSVDRKKIAQRLNDQRPDDRESLNICIQVNIDNEDTKSGVTPEQIFELANDITALPKLTLRGIMVIPAKTANPDVQKRSFQKAKQLFNELKQIHPAIDTLSMGMSADKTLAIAEGSTLVRVGSALFGQRPTPNKSGRVN